MRAYKTYTRTAAWLLSAALTISLLPVRALAQETVELNVGETVQLPDVEPSDNGEQAWSVDDENIVSVEEDGTITGLQPGETVVRHTYYVEKVTPAQPLPEVLPEVPAVPEQPELPADVPAQPEVPEEVPEQPSDVPEQPEETPELPTDVENPEELPAETPDTPADSEQEESPTEPPALEPPSETPDADEAEEVPEEPSTSDTPSSAETPDVPASSEPTAAESGSDADTAPSENPTDDAASSDAPEDAGTGAPDSASDASDAASDGDRGDRGDAADASSDAPSDDREVQTESASLTYNDDAPTVDESEVSYVTHIQSWHVAVRGGEVTVALQESAVYDGVRVDVTAYSDSFETVPAQVKIQPVVLAAERSAVENAADAALEEVSELVDEPPVAAFDITFLNDAGEEMQPTGTPVDVTFSLTEELAEDAENLSVYHVDAALTEATPMELSEQSADRVTVAADSFSIYVLTLWNTKSTEYHTIRVGETMTLVCDAQKKSNYNSRWTVDSDEIRMQQDSDTQVTITGVRAGKTVTVTHQYTKRQGWGNTVVHEDTYQITVVPDTVTLKDTIRENGSLTVEADGADLTDGTYQFAWTVNGEPVTDDAFSCYVDSKTGNSVPNTLFVAQNGAQKVFAVTVSKVDQDGKQTVLGTSAPMKVDYYDALQNGSFEEPETLGGYDGGCFHQIPVTTPGLYWKTTGLGTGSNKNRDIEIIEAGWQSGNTYGMASAVEGDRFAELNCENWGALYQDVLTVPGSTLYWGVSHAARFNSSDTSASQTMYIVVANANDNDIKGWEDGKIDFSKMLNCQQDSVTSNQKGVWTRKTGVYKVPEGQYVTRFYFACDPNSSYQTMGNLIDLVSFGKELPPVPPSSGTVKIEKTVTGIPAGTTVPANAFTFRILDSKNQVVETISLPKQDTVLNADEPLVSLTTLKNGTYTVQEVLGENPFDELYAYDADSSETSEKTVVLSGKNAVETAAFTNAYQFQSPTTHITVRKVWEGENNEQGRPQTVTVQLYQNQKPYRTVTLDAAHDWTATFDNLPWYDSQSSYANGQRVVYRLEETKMDDQPLKNNRVLVGKDGSYIEDNDEITSAVSHVWASFCLQKVVDGVCEIDNVRYDAEDVPDGKLNLQKVSDTADAYPIANVGFTLSKDGELLDEQFTDKDGRLSFCNLADGTYTLEETYTPDNYQKLDGSLRVTLEKGEIKKVVEKPGNSSIFQNFWNWVVGSDQYNKETDTLTVTNTPQATSIQKTVWTVADDTFDPEKGLQGDGNWMDGFATYFPAEQETAKIFFKVTVYGGYQASYRVSDVMPDALQFTLLSGKENGTLDTQTEDGGGKAELYYEAVLPLSTVETTYRNTATLENGMTAAAQVSLYKERPTEPEVGSLRLEKRVVIDDWTAIPEDYAATISYGAQSVTFGKADFVQGDGYYTASETIDGLAPGTYPIHEEVGGVDGYTLTATEEQTAAVEPGKTTDVLVTNQYEKEVPILPETGNLHLEKRVVIDDWAAVPSNYTVTISYGTASVTFEKTDFVQSGDYYMATKTVNGLTPGAYAISEQAGGVNGYTLTKAHEDTVEVKTNASTDVTVVNQYTAVPDDPNPHPDGGGGGGRDSRDDDDTPAVVVPDTPTTDIPDEEPPHTDLPDVTPPDVDIPEEDVPTTDLPDAEVPAEEFVTPGRTGDSMAVWGLSVLSTGLCLLWLKGRRRREQ